MIVCPKSMGKVTPFPRFLGSFLLASTLVFTFSVTCDIAAGLVLTDLVHSQHLLLLITADISRTSEPAVLETYFPCNDEL